jgi:hypothetical protein
MKMFPRILAGLALALGLCSGGAMAGEAAQFAGEAAKLSSGQVVFSIGLPVVLPTLVVVQPGVSVIPNQSVEVFFSGGYYWTRRDGGWYRTHDHNGSWSRIDDRQVPMVIARSPPGQYKHYKGNGNGHGNDKGKSDKGHDKQDKKGGGHD